MIDPKKAAVGVRQIELNGNIASLSISVVQESQGPAPCEYGLKLTLLPQGEACAFSSLTTSEEEVRALADAMLEGLVLPSTARDVVEDWLVSRDGLYP